MHCGKYLAPGVGQHSLRSLYPLGSCSKPASARDHSSHEPAAPIGSLDGSRPARKYKSAS
jgi:hypothetical protein